MPGANEGAVSDALKKARESYPDGGRLRANARDPDAGGAESARPGEGDLGTRSVTLSLTREQVNSLDRSAMAIREATGTRPSRSGMVRAILDVVLDADPSWGRAATEEELREVVRGLLR